MRVTVVGAGVVGLTCAVRLLEEGHRVDVLARDLPLETTSAVAAAIWYPYRAFPFDRVLAWSARSYDAFAALAGVDGAGVTMRSGIEVFAAPQDEPWWRSAVPALDHVPPPAGYGDAWTFEAPVVEMPVYLTWLASRVDELGGTITRLNLSALPVGPDVVVNCAGIGARLLAADSVGRTGAGPGRAPLAGRPGAVVPRLLGRPHVRRPSRARHRGRGDGPGRRVEPDPVPRRRRGHPRAGAAGWCRSWRPRRCCGIGSGCVPLARRYGWSGSATWFIATATVVRASR